MPTVFRRGPYRFFFFSREPNEPRHIHVERDTLGAKFWIRPVSLARNDGFSEREIRRLHQLVSNHESEIEEAWNEHFGPRSR